MFRGVCIMVLLALSVYTNEGESKSVVSSKTLDQKCREETHHVRNHSLSMAQAMTNDPTTRCYAACMLKGNGEVNEDNSFNVTKWLQLAPNVEKDTTLLHAVNQCSGEKDPDPCESAYKFYMCLNRNGIHGER